MTLPRMDSDPSASDRLPPRPVTPTSTMATALTHLHATASCATADQLKTQRESLFKGETLRGLLLSSYAWATIGRIAAIGAWVAFTGAAVMTALVATGLVHLRRMKA